MSKGSIEVAYYTRYDSNRGSSRTRAFEYMKPLARLGISANVIPRVDQNDVLQARAFVDVLDAALAGATVVVQKPNLSFAQLEQLHEAADGRVAVDFDDAIWMGYGPGDPVDGLKSLEETIRQAAAVTAGSEHLARWAREIRGGDVEVIPPSVDLDRYTLVREHEHADRPVVVWIGSAGSYGDFEAATRPLQELSGQGRIRLRVMSDQPLDPKLWPKAEWTRWSFDDEVQNLVACDIGIMPLVENERSRGRCGYKAVQYQAVGLPVVASSVGGAAEAVIDGTTGLFARSDSEWLDTIDRLAGDVDLRASLGAAGRRHVEENHSIETNAARVADLLKRIAKSGSLLQ